MTDAAAGAHQILHYEGHIGIVWSFWRIYKWGKRDMIPIGREESLLSRKMGTCFVRAQKSRVDTIHVRLLTALSVRFPRLLSVWSLFWANWQTEIIISLTQSREISLSAPALLSWINKCDSQPLSTTEQSYSCSKQKRLVHSYWPVFNTTALKWCNGHTWNWNWRRT